MNIMWILIAGGAVLVGGGLCYALLGGLAQASLAKAGVSLLLGAGAGIGGDWVATQLFYIPRPKPVQAALIQQGVITRCSWEGGLPGLWFVEEVRGVEELGLEKTVGTQISNQNSFFVMEGEAESFDFKQEEIINGRYSCAGDDLVRAVVTIDRTLLQEATESEVPVDLSVTLLYQVSVSDRGANLTFQEAYLGGELLGRINGMFFAGEGNQGTPFVCDTLDMACWNSSLVDLIRSQAADIQLRRVF